MASKSGWWVRVNLGEQEATSISFKLGTREEDRTDWRVWRQGEPNEFDVPETYRQLPKLYMYAVTGTGKRNSNFDVFYQGNRKQHWDFDGDEDHNMER